MYVPVLLSFVRDRDPYLRVPKRVIKIARYSIQVGIVR